MIKRIITALVLIPLVLLAIFFLPRAWFGLASAAVILLAAWEWGNLIGIKSNKANALHLFVLAILMVIIYQLPLVWVLIAGCIWWIVASLWLLIYPRGNEMWQKTWVKYLIGGLVLIPTWVALFSLQAEFGHMGPWYILFMLLVIWAMDTGAYFVGKKWGRTPCAPNISPKKTVQGLYGGFAIVAVVDIFIIFGFQLSWRRIGLVLLISLITAIVAVIGDLVESMFKRYQGVKDSGNILPGHGGILDRIDSLTAAAPIFALIITIIELKGMPY